ncbi:hypothetical protein [Kitasatospora cinereorecta]|uniref:hypothetical protein n=1 Tax=Kitasatospora cinereorecta TaxID=285560 RepID=UPI0031F971A2
MSGGDLSYQYERLNQDLEFKPVGSGPLRYADSTDKQVEYLAAVTAEGRTRGYLWFCDEDGAAAFEQHLVQGEFNGMMFWDRGLRAARARDLTPSQAVEELLAEEGGLLSGRLDPASRTVGTLAEVKARAAEGYRPPQEPYRPRGRRPDPKPDPQDEERVVGRWLYRVDEGHDPAGRVPSHAVAGAWQFSEWGRALRFWHNPAYGEAPGTVEAAPAGEAAPVPPLRAGRRPAGLALLAWLEDPRAPRFCRIGGSSGSGRTHLLSWLAAACPPDNPRPGRRVHALLPAEGLTVRSATWLLAERLGVVARTPDQLMAALQDGVPRALVVTDLDRAGGDLLPDMPRRIAEELLTPLLQIPWVRLVVEAGSGTAAAELLTAVAPAGAVLDLDDPRWTDPERFAAWCAEIGGHQVAADRVYPSPGLAHLAARTAAAPGTDSAAPLDERAAALAAAWWTALPPALHPTVGALAATGAAVSAEAWSSLPGSGGAEAVGAAAAYLVPAGDGRWRLRPDRLAQHVADALPPVDHTARLRDIAGAIPRAADGRPELSSTDPHWLGLLLRHAVHAGAGEQLLADADFLVHADPVAIAAAFERTLPEDGPQTPLAEAWHLAGPVRPTTATPAERAAALHGWLAGRDQPAADHCAAVSGQRWRATWSGPFRGRLPVQAPRGEGEVSRILRGHGPYAGHLLVATPGLLRFLDPDTGLDAEKVEPSRIQGGRQAAVVCGQEGSLFFLGTDGRATTWPYPADRGGDPSTAVDWVTRNRPDGVTALATFAAGGLAHLAAGDAGGALAWATMTGDRRAATPQPLHRGEVTAVDLTATADGLLLLSGGTDGAVRTFDTGRGEAGEPLDTRDCPVTAVAVAITPHGTVTAAAWADGLVRLRRGGSDPLVADLRLGLAAHSLVVEDSGRIFAGFPEGVVALALDHAVADQDGGGYRLRHDRPEVLALGPAGPVRCRVSCWFDGRAERGELYAVLADGPWGRVEARSADAFGALLEVRRQLEAHGVLLALAGARRDVWPSGMVRDSGGEEAYLLVPATSGEAPPLLSIFADAPPELVASVADQSAAAEAWFRQGS